MGLWKKLKQKALEGSRESMLLIARQYEAQKDYRVALHWYSAASDTKKCKEIRKLMSKDISKDNSTDSTLGS